MDNKAKKGFTLVELIVAMAITSILVMIIVAMTSRGVDIWRSVLQTVSSTSDARAVLDKMAEDLESIQMRAGNNFEWLFAERDQDLASGATTMGPKGMQFANAARLLFFTVASDRNPAISSRSVRTYNQDMRSSRTTMGDVNCVGYKLVYRDMILDMDGDMKGSGFPVYALYRNVVPAYHTFDDLLGKQDLYQAYKRFEPQETRPTNFLAENIIELTLTFEVMAQTTKGATRGDKNYEATTELVSVPIITTGSRGSNGYRRLSIYGDSMRVEREGSRDAVLSSGEIQGVSISITVISTEGMQLLQQVRKGAARLPRSDVFFEKYTKQYNQYVSLPKPN